MDKLLVANGHMGFNGFEIFNSDLKEESFDSQLESKKVYYKEDMIYSIGRDLNTNKDSIYLYKYTPNNELLRDLLYTSDSGNIVDSIILWPYLYIGVDKNVNIPRNIEEMSEIRILDLRDKSIKSVIPLTYTSWPEGNNFNLLAIKDDLLLVVNKNVGIEVYDIKDIQNPEFKFVYRARNSGFEKEYFDSIKISGNNVYAGSFYSGPLGSGYYLTKFDFNKWKLVKTGDLYISDRLNKMYSYGGFVFFGTESGNVYIIDDRYAMNIYTNYLENINSNNIVVSGNLLFSTNFFKNTYILKLE